MEKHKCYVNAYWVQSILGLGKLIILGSLFSLRVFLKVPWYCGTLNVWWPVHLPYEILKRVMSQGKKWKKKKLPSSRKVAIQMVDCSWVLLQSQMVWQDPGESALPTTTTTPHGCSCNNMFSIHHRRPLISNVMSTHYHSTPAWILLHGSGMRHWKRIYFGGKGFDEFFDIIRVFIFLGNIHC